MVKRSEVNDCSLYIHKLTLNFKNNFGGQPNFSFISNDSLKKTWIIDVPKFVNSIFFVDKKKNCGSFLKTIQCRNCVFCFLFYTVAWHYRNITSMSINWIYLPSLNQEGWNINKHSTTYSNKLLQVINTEYEYLNVGVRRLCFAKGLIWYSLYLNGVTQPRMNAMGQIQQCIKQTWRGCSQMLLSWIV